MHKVMLGQDNTVGDTVLSNGVTTASGDLLALDAQTRAADRIPYGLPADKSTRGLGLWFVEVSHLRLTVSQDARAIQGMPRDLVHTVGEFLNGFAPEFRETIIAAFWACAREGKAFDLESQIITHTGQRIWVRTIGEAVRDAAGVISGVQGVLQDLSERRQAVDETRRLAERLSTTLESITDAFFTLDREWRFTYLNREAERLLRRTRAQLLGQDWRMEFASALDSAFGREYRRAMAGKITVEFEEYFPLLKSWFSVRAYPSADGLAVYFLDITERRRTLQRLNEAQRIGLMGDWEYSLATGITWSPQVFEIFGRDPGRGPPRNLQEASSMYDASSSALMEEKVALALKSGKVQQYQLLALRPDGTKIHIQLIASPRKDENGNVVSLHGTVQDISERKRDEEAIHDRARQQELIAVFGRSVLANWDLGNMLTWASSAVAKGLNVGYSMVTQLTTSGHLLILVAGVGWEPGWLGREPGRVNGIGPLPEVLASGEPAIVNDFASELPASTPEILRSHGIASSVEVAIVCSDGPWGVIGGYSREAHRFTPENLDFIQSIANLLAMGIDRKRRDVQLEHLAQYDPLTDLPNRLLLNDRLAVALAQAHRSGTRLAVLCLDLDRFKYVNDSFGHGVGDRLLQEVARRLTAAVRASDTVSRQGGDEFAIVLREAQNDKAVAGVAEKLIRSMGEPVRIGNVELLVSGSIGIACFPENGNNCETLLRKADAALYAAKDTGRNCHRFYSEEMSSRANERLILEADLRRAVARDEFFLQFQPQVSMRTGWVTGVEALVRWRHPAFGIVPPSRFIPVAEDSGLIVSVGNWVLEAACGRQARWVADGVRQGRMAVNVSALQFRQQDFVATVAQILESTGLQSRYLELELTESAVMEGIDSGREKLIGLNELGVTLAIDDFGTGQSSLSYLKQFPIHRLKIDQSFVAGLPDDKEDAAITQAIISMAHSLGLNVIAEGIETAAQASYLKLLGCDDAQGFYYSRPLFPVDCATFLQSADRLRPHLDIAAD